MAGTYNKFKMQMLLQTHHSYMDVLFKFKRVNFQSLQSVAQNKITISISFSHVS